MSQPSEKEKEYERPLPPEELKQLQMPTAPYHQTIKHHDIGDIKITLTFKPASRTLLDLHRFIGEGQEREIIGDITESDVEEFLFNVDKQNAMWVKLYLNLDTWKYELHPVVSEK